MSQPLHVGIIGLGPRWQKRYRPALLALRERFRVVAFCDPLPQRAEQEARLWGCPAVAGPTVLLENTPIDAVLLLEPHWWRLWPLELACRFDKPVYCGAALERDIPHADAIAQQVRDSRLPVLVELAPRVAAATERLRQLLANDLGPARLLVCDLTLPLNGRSKDASSLLGSAGTALVDWCAGLLDTAPESVLASSAAAGQFSSVLLEYGDGRAVQINRRLAPGARRSLTLRVVAERGSAKVSLPSRVAWNGADGGHLHVLPEPRPLVETLLEQFHDQVTRGQAPTPGLDEAHRALGWLRAAEVSRKEGRRIGLRAAD